MPPFHLPFFAMMALHCVLMACPNQDGTRQGTEVLMTQPIITWGSAQAGDRMEPRRTQHYTDHSTKQLITALPDPVAAPEECSSNNLATLSRSSATSFSKAASLSMICWICDDDVPGRGAIIGTQSRRVFAAVFPGTARAVGGTQCSDMTDSTEMPLD